MPGLPVRATLLCLAAALAACDRGNAPSDAPPLTVKVAVVSQEGVPLYLEHTGNQKALLVPEQAILSDRGGNYVLVLQQEGTIASRPVVATQRIDGKRVIETGLDAGELVLIDHLQQARPGMRAVAQTAGPGGTPAAL